MNFPLFKKEEFDLDEARSFSHVPEAQIKAVWEYVIFKAIDNYTNKKKIIIPFIGEIELNYLGDEEVNNQVVAKLETKFYPSFEFRKLISDLEDGADSVLTNLFEEKIKDELELKTL